MLAVTTVNPARSKHFYLGFQAEHKLGAGALLVSGAGLPYAALCCLHTARSVRPLVTSLGHLSDCLHIEDSRLQSPLAVLPCCHPRDLPDIAGRWQPRAAVVSPAPALRCSGPVPHAAARACAERCDPARAPRAGAEAAQDLSAHREVRMEAKVGVFGRGMASVKIQYFVEGQAYGLFKARPRRHALACVVSAAAAQALLRLRRDRRDPGGQARLPATPRPLRHCSRAAGRMPTGRGAGGAGALPGGAGGGLPAEVRTRAAVARGSRRLPGGLRGPGGAVQERRAL
jgi:hypothetical protein